MNPTTKVTPAKVIEICGTPAMEALEPKPPPKRKRPKRRKPRSK
jgi:hypothetical protein